MELSDKSLALAIQQPFSCAASSTLICKVCKAVWFDPAASALVVMIAVIADFAVLLDEVLGLTVGVIYFHDVEVENGEGFQHDSIGVRPIGQDSSESTIKSGI